MLADHTKLNTHVKGNVTTGNTFESGYNEKKLRLGLLVSFKIALTLCQWKFSIISGSGMENLQKTTTGNSRDECYFNQKSFTFLFNLQKLKNLSFPQSYLDSTLAKFSEFHPIPRNKC
jgi:hypothetical protein